MAMWTTAGLLLLILHTAVGQDPIRWCTISDAEARKCQDMSFAFLAYSIYPSLQCVSGDSVEDCVQKLQTKEADVFSMFASDIYKYGKTNSFKMVASESKNGDTFSYIAVAVVKKANSDININNLAGKKSCHTGKRRTAGWKMPLGYFIDQGLMSVMGCDISQGVANLFSASCIPGANEPGDPPSLCELCKGDGNGNHKCEWSDKEQYFSYEGAFRCLAEDAGEVAFIKHTIVEENTDGRGPEWAQNLKLRSEDFELLCRDGSRAPVSEWKTCHLVTIPFRGIVVNTEVKPPVVFQMLQDALQMPDFNIFSSEDYGGGTVIFSSMSTRFEAVESEEPTLWFNDRYYAAMKAMDCNAEDIPSQLRWCLVSSEEERKCADMTSAFNSQSLIPEISCVRGQSVTDCMTKIKNNEADAITLNGRDVYTAGKDYGLIPAAAESYTDDRDATIYYAVAVVKKSNTNIRNFDDLRGRLSCHTGYGRNAGWSVISALLMDKGLIKPENCQIAQAMGGFFKQSCVPGANQPGFPSSLCELCVGDDSGQHKCEKGKDRYDGYEGAFRCLAEETGDVAFVKHTTVPDNTDGQGSEPWNSGLLSADFELLCPQGGRMDISRYRECNLSRVPSNAVMVRPGTNINFIYGLLDEAQKHFGSDTGSGFKMFDSTTYGGTNLIFRDSCTRILGVGDRKTYQEWLGRIYMQGMVNKNCNELATGQQ